MKSVQNHYDEFLAPVYSWILGDFDAARRANVKLFADLALTPTTGDLAVDLGCGPGCQSLPLAEAGYRVIAIDFCQALLDELAGRSADLPIEAVCDDVLNFDAHLDAAPALVTCMGDTLVHLPALSDVNALLDKVATELRPGGTFVYSIRDYVSWTPVGAERFVPIRASDEQIFTCFLDYQPDVVHVHDVLYTRHDGEWRFTVSDYLKLRLDTTDINARLAAGGLSVISQSQSQGMIHVVAVKPDRP